MTAAPLLLALRPAQWTKNLLCFVPLLFTRSFRDPAAVLAAVLATAVLCLLSSAAYLANDVLDRNRDRANPRTAHRPVASGAVSPETALAVSFLLALLGLLLSFPLGLLPVVAVFLALQALYTAFARHHAGVDVVVIGVLFVLRAVAGAVVIHVATSPWLFGVAFLAALRIALAKRAAEASTAPLHRPAAAQIPAETWNAFGTAVTGAILATYALYAFSSLTAETLSGLASNLPGGIPPLLLTYPFVAYCLFRFELLARSGAAAEPERLVWTDPGLFGGILAWFLSVVAVMA